MGMLNNDQLKERYQLGGKRTVLEGCRRYGKFAYESPTLRTT